MRMREDVIRDPYDCIREAVGAKVRSSVLEGVGEAFLCEDGTEERTKRLVFGVFNHWVGEPFLEPAWKEVGMRRGVDWTKNHKARYVLWVEDYLFAGRPPGWIQDYGDDVLITLVRKYHQHGWDKTFMRCLYLYLRSSPSTWNVNPDEEGEFESMLNVLDTYSACEWNEPRFWTSIFRLLGSSATFGSDDSIEDVSENHLLWERVLERTPGRE